MADPTPEPAAPKKKGKLGKLLVMLVGVLVLVGGGIGAGLSDIDMGLRLRYEFSRKVAPYIGVSYQRRFGGTESLTREQGGHVNDVRFLFGLRLWY